MHVLDWATNLKVSYVHFGGRKLFIVIFGTFPLKTPPRLNMLSFFSLPSPLLLFSCLVWCRLHHVKPVGAILHSGTVVANLDLDDPSKLKKAKTTTQVLPEQRHQPGKGGKVHQVKGLYCTCTGYVYVSNVESKIPRFAVS